MAEITTTQSFSDGDIVTATKLNNIQANSSIQPDIITNKSSEATVDPVNDFVLMYDSSAVSLKKVTPSNIVRGGTTSDFPIGGNATISGTLAVTGAISATSTINGTTIPATKTLVTTTDTQTLTSKTLTTPIISSISNTGTITLPTSTDTLVGRATTDTLTNKTLTSPVISGGTINNATIGATTASSASFTTISASGLITASGGVSGNVIGNLTGNASGSSSSCTGNAATATTASACTGNSATATTASACSGNSATATTASACTGNSATATTLQNTRTINGISFNGSGNIITNPSTGAYSNGYGARTVTSVTSTPTGGADGDIVYVI